MINILLNIISGNSTPVTPRFEDFVDESHHEMTPLPAKSPIATPSNNSNCGNDNIYTSLRTHTHKQPDINSNNNNCSNPIPPKGDAILITYQLPIHSQLPTPCI